MAINVASTSLIKTLNQTFPKPCGEATILAKIIVDSLRGNRNTCPALPNTYLPCPMQKKDFPLPRLMLKAYTLVR
jgi:hypothetical protein